MSRGLGRVQMAVIDFLAAVVRNADVDPEDGWLSASVVASDIEWPHPRIGNSAYDDLGPRYEYEATRRALASLRRMGVVDARAGERGRIEYRLSEACQRLLLAD